MGNLKNLTSPIKVGAKTYAHRMVAAPIYCGTFINIPEMCDVLDRGIKTRAKGKAAAVTIGETPVDFEGASREPFPPIDYYNFDDPSMPKFKELIGYIKSQGSVALIELSHCGESVEKIPGVEFGIGPMGYTRPDGMVVYAMDEERMQRVTEHFIQAAKWMKEAGVDGVMIHAGHGWLLHQFLSPRTNKRTDEYGGSLENRARFPLMLIKAVRDAMGPDFIIEIRVSGEECMGEEGMHVDETAAFVKMAEPYIDIVNVSVGTYRNPILSGEFSSMFQAKALNMSESEVIKKQVNIPVSVVGGITDPEIAEMMIAEGKCDIVALGRPLTADPDYPKKVLEGREDDIARCIRCFRCFQGPLEGTDLTIEKMFGCTVNPSAFCMDKELLESRPLAVKNVLVVGGGIAGLTAAVTAKERGHKVTLVEKSDRLGGVLFFTDTDYYKQGLKAFRDLMIKRAMESGIDIRLNTECTKEIVDDIAPDHIIIAVGASSVAADIKGIEYAVQALDVYRGAPIGNKVIMLGSGLVGCETAIDLAFKGKDVTVVSRSGRLANGGYPMHKLALLNEMEGMVKVVKGLSCQEIKVEASAGENAGADKLSSAGPEKTVVFKDENGAIVEMTADTVIHAFGMKANEDIVEEIKAWANVPCDVVGDCKCAAKVYDAGRDAYLAAMKL